MLRTERKNIVVEPCEVAQPSTTKASPSNNMSLSEVKDSIVPFLKLKSPTNSEFDQDSDQNSISDSEEGNSIATRIGPLSEIEELHATERQLPLQTVELFDSQNDISIMVCHESSHPSTTLGELVTGSDSSNSSSRLSLTRSWSSRPDTRFKYLARVYPCLDRELRAQQIILTRGWSEGTSNQRKRSLKNFDLTQNLTNGHPIGKCILNAFRKDALYYRGDLIGQRKGTPLVNSSQNTTPHRKLFSQEVDESISSWEKAFFEQFRHERILFKGCDITTPFLLVLLYRCAYQGSILIEHFTDSECNDCLSCSLGVQKTMIKLKKFHIDTCEAARHISRHDGTVKSTMDKISINCDLEQLHLFYLHCDNSAHRFPYIEFPHVVEVGIQFRKEKTTKIRRIIYMQIPPYFFAVPADCCGNTTFQELKSHFPRVIEEIHKELTFEREYFFEQRPDLRDKENLAMIYPYRFDSDSRHSECRFLRVNIKVDRG